MVVSAKAPNYGEIWHISVTIATLQEQIEYSSPYFKHLYLFDAFLDRKGLENFGIRRNLFYDLARLHSHNFVNHCLKVMHSSAGALVRPFALRLSP